MEIKNKKMNKSSWTRILEREYYYSDFLDGEYQGVVSLLYAKKVREPLYKYDNKVCIVDDGYSWIQIGLENRNCWITIVYNELDEFVQCYIDVTKSNEITYDNEDCYNDLFLDIVRLSNKEVFILDEEELKKALDEGVILKEDYSFAYDMASKIKEFLENDREFKRLEDFSIKYLKMLREKKVSY